MGVLIGLFITCGIIGTIIKKDEETQPKKEEKKVEESATEEEKKAEESATETEEEPVATTTPEPEPVPTPPSTEAQLKSAVGSSMGTVTYDPASQTATVTKTDKDPFGPTEATRAAFANFVNFGEKAVNVTGVNTICAVYLVPLQDQYGKTADDTVVRLVMPSSEFVKFDWKALEYQPISDKLQASCTEYYIHPALAGTRPSDLFLEP